MMFHGFVFSGTLCEKVDILRRRSGNLRWKMTSKFDEWSAKK